MTALLALTCLALMAAVSARNINVGLCDDWNMDCKCGTNPGYAFRVPIKQCSHFHRWQMKCRPCDKREESDVCPIYLNCQECEEKKCASCPTGKFGEWCTGDCLCQNGATCNRDNGMCTCPENFEGQFCEKRKISTCGPPEAPVNGETQGFIGEEGTNITYVCITGYAVIGNQLRTCTANRTWTGSVPTCVPQCSMPKLTKGLSARINLGYKENQTDANGQEVLRELLFSCSGGLQLLGQKDLRCISPENWGAATPQCINACFKPLAPSNGAVEVAKVIDGKMESSLDDDIESSTEVKIKPTQPPLENTDFVPLGTRAIYSCKSRYYNLKGPKSRVCAPNARWTGKQPACELTCGKAPGIKSPTIVNGNVSDVGQWPWQAGLAFKVPKTANWVIVCGGSLLNQNWVVTAAHCVTEKDTSKLRNKSQMRIYMGKHFREDTKDDNLVQVRRVSMVLVHPNYHPQSLDSDIALIELSQPVRLTSRVLPICLPDPAEVDIMDHVVEGSEGVVTGWGIVGTGLASPVLQYAKLPVVAKRKCEEDYMKTNYTVTVTANMYCAGFKDGIIGTCRGDSGGPMAFETGTGPDRKYILMGLLSWGGIDGCAIPHQYSGFTFIYEFLNWIYQYI